MAPQGPPCHPTTPTVEKKKRRNSLKPGKTAAKPGSKRNKNTWSDARWYRYMNNVIPREFLVPAQTVFPAKSFRDVPVFL